MSRDEAEKFNALVRQYTFSLTMNAEVSKVPASMYPKVVVNTAELLAKEVMEREEKRKEEAAQ